MARSKSKNTGSNTPKAEDSVKAQKDGAIDSPLTLAPETSTPEKSSTNGAVSNDAKASPTSPYVKEIEKRLGKWSKKKRGIDTIELKIEGLNEQERGITKLINNDEKKKLAEKPLVEERVKEYQEILSSMAAVAAAEDQQQASEKAAAEAEAAAKAEAARKEGYEQGVKDQQETLLTCFRFLRLAGFRRAMPDENAAENEAIEKVLIMVYSSEESATAAIESLAASKDEVIEGSEGVTYARVKEISDALHTTGEEESAETVGEPSATQTSELGESTVIVTDGDTEATPVETAPPQTLVTSVEDVTAPAPAATLVDDSAANSAAQSGEASEEWDKVHPGGKSSENGTPATSWADQSHEESAKVAEAASTEPVVPVEGQFTEVPTRSQGHRGRGGYRGPRGGGEYRGGFRGGRGGSFRGQRGEFRGGRGEFRGGERGGYRGGRGGDRPYRPRGDRGGHDAPATPAPAQTTS